MATRTAGAGVAAAAGDGAVLGLGRASAGLGLAGTPGDGGAVTPTTVGGRPPRVGAGSAADDGEATADGMGLTTGETAGEDDAALTAGAAVAGGAWVGVPDDPPLHAARQSIQPVLAQATSFETRRPYPGLSMGAAPRTRAAASAGRSERDTMTTLRMSYALRGAVATYTELMSVLVRLP